MYIAENCILTFMRYFILFLILPLINYGRSLESKDYGNGNEISLNYKSNTKKHIVLLGASIGRAWNVSSLPDRLKNNDYVFEYIHGGGSDKSKKLKEILSRRENKPDAIFIKQCAAYFPGNLMQIKSLMKKWIKECYEAKVIPIPTTVVPVTRLHPLKKFLIDIIKGRNPFKHGGPFRNRRTKAILEYNDWIRMYCKKNDLSILDLEKSLRYNKKNRHLRGKFAKLDGLHLNKKAYKILDQIVIPALQTVNWENKYVRKRN